MDNNENKNVVTQNEVSVLCIKDKKYLFVSDLESAREGITTGSIWSDCDTAGNYRQTGFFRIGKDGSLFVKKCE